MTSPSKTLQPFPETPSRHEMIGVLTPLLVGTYMSEVISGIANAADARGARIVVIQTLDQGVEGAEPPVRRSIRRLDYGDDLVGWPGDAEAMVPQFTLRAAWDRVVGFIVALNAVEPWYLHALREAGKPVVIISDEVRDFPCPVVRPDNRGGIIKAVTHLVGHGHRHIAFAGSLAQLDGRERRDAYREALASNGLDAGDDLFFKTVDNLEDGGEIAGRSMLAAGMPSTAVVAATDYNAIGIMRVLREAGLILPRDQAIVGFDDVDASSSVRPTLSTVHTSVEEAARTATNLLLDMVHGREVAAGRHLVPTEFVPRESCGCSAASTVEGLETPDELLPHSPRDRLRLRLERQLLGLDPPTAGQAAALDRAVDLIVRCVAPREAEPAPDGFHEAAQALSSVNPRSTAITATMACLRQYGREVTPRPGDTNGLARFERGINELAVELAQSLAQGEANVRAAFRREMSVRHRLSMSLLSSDEGDPRSLGWLSHTAARGGCLGLWSKGAAGESDSGLLDIAGLYIRDGGPLRLPAQARVEEFPPDALLEDLEWEPWEIAVLLPAKTSSMDLGLLALVTPVDTDQIKGYDRLFEEGALVSVSIEREVITERLRRSNADLATFSHAMAHDLRNPIATISMWSSVAQSQSSPGDDAGPVLQIVDQISEVARYANDLVTELLHYAELDRGDATSEPVNLNVAAGRALATVESAVAEQGATIETGELPTVRGRFAELELVLQNLIENSVKYHGGRSPRIRIDAARNGGSWTVRCRDNGEGVPVEVRERVFEPFVRGHASVPGSGLGLATCRRIVEGHGGRIWIESSGEAGTTIAFTLPASPDLKSATTSRSGLAATASSGASDAPPAAVSARSGHRPRAQPSSGRPRRPTRLPKSPARDVQG
jgi:DNA-binding LacI/PurR family transcriptional regulator/signal transduction histidine kinase